MIFILFANLCASLKYTDWIELAKNARNNLQQPWIVVNVDFIANGMNSECWMNTISSLMYLPLCKGISHTANCVSILRRIMLAKETERDREKKGHSLIRAHSYSQCASNIYKSTKHMNRNVDDWSPVPSGMWIHISVIIFPLFLNILNEPKSYIRNSGRKFTLLYILQIIACI